jgi:hypothetical protein
VSIWFDTIQFGRYVSMFWNNKLPSASGQRDTGDAISSSPKNIIVYLPNYMTYIQEKEMLLIRS